MSRAEESQNGAARWILAREDGGWSEADQAEFEAWLAKSSMNRVAFIRLEHCWREADRIGSLGAAQMPDTLRNDRSIRARFRAVKWWVPLAAAASLLPIIGIGIGMYESGASGHDVAPQLASTLYGTKFGEHKIIGLPDGSKVELNTASEMRTAVNDASREIWLDQGEAYFEVVHDEHRPFVVHAGNRQVTVLGTKFSVRRDGDKVNLFVREGRVRVDDIENGHAVRSTTIVGGDIALTRGGATLVTSRSEEQVEDALAWRIGMLSFDQASLSEVAAEFNRYNRRKLIVADPSVADIKIGGTYPASQPVEFVHLLRDAYGLKIKESSEEIEISD